MLARTAEAASEPNRVYTVSGWQISQYDTYCLAHAKPMTSGSTLFFFALGPRGFTAIVGNKKWKMTEGRKATVFVEIDGERFGALATEAFSDDMVEILLPLKIGKALQAGDVVTLRFELATYTFALKNSRQGLAALADCYANKAGDKASVETADRQRQHNIVDPEATIFDVKNPVEGGVANMRQGPGIGWPIVAKVPAGTRGLRRTGPCQDRDDGKTQRPWCPFVWNGARGFISTLNLETPDQPPGAEMANYTDEEGSKTSSVSTGTGFFVSAAGHVLTNAHVASECQSLTAALPGAPHVTARLVAVDQVNDLALLSVPEIRPNVVPSLVSSVRTGATVAVYGFPLSGALSTNGNFTTGLVSATTGLRDNSGMLQITAPVQPGNSGGPVLDENGNVVGVVVAKLDALAVASIIKDVPQNVNFAIKSSVARIFLDAHGVPLSEAPIGNSQIFSNPDLADRAKSFTVIVRCRQ